MNRNFCLIACSIIASCFPSTAHSQDASESESEALKRMREYQLVEIGEDDPLALQLHEQSVLNWSNPVFGTTDGGFFVWTRADRVAAVMKTYKTKNGRWFEQVRSFSTRPLVARQTVAAAPFWSPPPAAEMKKLEGSPPPAATAAARLVQMKALHRSFSVIGKLNSGRQELRPLPRPLYRYKSDGITDGALLAYVQGTGPDMLLILEARTDDAQTNWYYALGSVGIFEVEVERGGTTVWSEPRRTAQSTEPTDIYDGRRLSLP